MKDAVITTPLREWRLREGLSLHELAGLTGVNVATLSLAERGLATISWRKRIAIARRLKTAVNILFPVDPIAADDSAATLENQALEVSHG